MRIVLFLIMSVLMIAGVHATGPRTPVAAFQGDCNCVSVRRIRGENCGSPRSLRIEFQNVCDHAVNAQIYARVNSQSARERVGGPTNLRPGTSSSYFWCQEPYEAIVACE
jgi:hypothetical protein